MKYKTVDEWIPADGFILEPKAIDTVKSEQNVLVIAGPGAGKTELLAQRACFLLETNKCPYPQKILAISFKRDAAYNLKERVIKRCGRDLALRFESMTFDAFAKNIVDRFRKGLPDSYAINSEYKIIFKEQDVFDIFESIDRDYRSSHTDKQILDEYYGKLPLSQDSIHYRVWTRLLGGVKSFLTFKMVMRLAELIMNANPKIREYLKETYSHIFLDEFQDTTTLQYEFLNTCFGDSHAVLTAVGDDKQRIMLWAGALPEIFDKFIKDYDASQCSLQMNFRSAPNLVELQNYLIANLLRREDLVICNPNWNKGDGEAYFCFFKNPQQEMEYLYSNVKRWINDENINPREICILVKQQLQKYAGELINYFNENKIAARDESKYQDLLTEEVILFIVNFLYLIDSNKAIDSKSYVLNFLSNINSSYSDKEVFAEEIKLHKFIERMRSSFQEDFTRCIESIVDNIIDFAGVDKIKSLYPAYKNKQYFAETIASFAQLLKEKAEGIMNLKAILDIITGVGVIPIMTIHKSKGLEYHTVIFMGLEDGAFWSYDKQPDEDKCAFFVALSRAKERVVFTFSQERNGRWQRLQKIDELFKSLIDSKKVVVQDLRKE
ncbi:ATP-dependent helicase [Alistipes sp.]|jgi:DNA helicase-2/ATP-dependent DNA helicase PcrA|uniref:UvrD-helicase domain-containing protein n=1 Tax=Alistipes sp. TaxID=1872444 RepID=UPI0023F57D1D|nr:ATP-dependent helicase [Alistipes sp.]